MFVIGGRFYRASRPGDNLFRISILKACPSFVSRQGDASPSPIQPEPFL
jgi:hypothetical protein